jgi:hypothetical protein
VTERDKSKDPETRGHKKPTPVSESRARPTVRRERSPSGEFVAFSENGEIVARGKDQDVVQQEAARLGHEMSKIAYVSEKRETKSASGVFTIIEPTVGSDAGWKVEIVDAGDSVFGDSMVGLRVTYIRKNGEEFIGIIPMNRRSR